MTRRDAVLKALQHEDVRPVPYYLDMTDEIADRMKAVTGDPFFLNIRIRTWRSSATNPLRIWSMAFSRTCSAWCGTRDHRRATSASCTSTF